MIDADKLAKKEERVQELLALAWSLFNAPLWEARQKFGDALAARENSLMEAAIEVAAKKAHTVCLSSEYDAQSTSEKAAELVRMEILALTTDSIRAAVDAKGKR